MNMLSKQQLPCYRRLCCFFPKKVYTFVTTSECMLPHLRTIIVERIIKTMIIFVKVTECASAFGCEYVCDVTRDVSPLYHMVTLEHTHRHYHTRSRTNAHRSDHQHINIRVVIFTAPHESTISHQPSHRTRSGSSSKVARTPQAATNLYALTDNTTGVGIRTSAASASHQQLTSSPASALAERQRHHRQKLTLEHAFDTS